MTSPRWVLTAVWALLGLGGCAWLPPLSNRVAPPPITMNIEAVPTPQVGWPDIVPMAPAPSGPPAVPAAPAPREQPKSAPVKTTSNRAVEQHLGRLAARERRFAQADAHFDAAWSQGPPTADLLNDIAYRLYLEGRLIEATKLLREALALDPASTAIRTNLGRTLARAGDMAEAAAMLRSACGDADAERQLAEALIDSGRHADAQVHYARAASLPLATAPVRTVVPAKEAGHSSTAAAITPTPPAPDTTSAPTSAALPDSSVVRSAALPRIRITDIRAVDE